MLYTRVMVASVSTPPHWYRDRRRQLGLSHRKLAAHPDVDVSSSMLLEIEKERSKIPPRVRAQLDVVLALGERGAASDEELLYLFGLDGMPGRPPYVLDDGSLFGCRSRPLAEAVAGLLRVWYPEDQAVPVPAWPSVVRPDQGLLLVDGDDEDSPLAPLFGALSAGTLPEPSGTGRTLALQNDEGRR